MIKDQISPSHAADLSPFLGPEVSEDLVPLVFHLAMDAADGDLLDQRLQHSGEELHTGAGAADKTLTSVIRQ